MKEKKGVKTRVQNRNNFSVKAQADGMHLYFYGDIVGKCPLCGKDVIRYRNGFSCSGYKEGCSFSVYGFLCHRVISKSNMQMLLETGRSSKIKGFISKNGKPFDAYLRLDGGRVVFDFKKEGVSSGDDRR